MCEHKPRTLLVGCISVFFAVASAQAGQSQETTLPSFELVSAIEDLAERIDAENAGLEPSFLSMRVARAGAEVPVEEAFAEEYTMFLLFESSVSENELRDYIDSNDVLILEVFPEIGAIQIRANLNAFLESRPTDSDANDTLLRGLAEAVNEYQSDFRIRSAAPGLLLRSQHNQSNPQIDDVCETKARTGRRAGTACHRRLSGYGKLRRHAVCRQPPKVGAVCVNAHVRI